MTWLNFLHLYQPANLESSKILEATEKSYEWLIGILEKNHNAKITLNIAGCLIERWAEDLNKQGLIERIKTLVVLGRIELVGSASHHCLLPLVSEKEAIYQINNQKEILEKYFGKDLVLNGFFLPELAYSKEIAKIIKKLGYKWLVVDDIAFTDDNILGKVFIDKNSDLLVMARNRIISESYVPETIAKNFDKLNNDILVTVSDAELYGFRHVDTENYFERLLNDKKIKTSTISEYILFNQPLAKKELVACSWQSTKQELKKNIPFALWNDPKNKIHQKMWELANLAEDIFRKYSNSEQAYWGRWHLNRGMASCAWWWASNKDFSNVFGPIAWSPEEVERGLMELLRSIRVFEKKTNLETKLKSEDLALLIRKLLWHRHWKK